MDKQKKVRSDTQEDGGIIWVKFKHIFVAKFWLTKGGIDWRSKHGGCRGAIDVELKEKDTHRYKKCLFQLGSNL